MGWWKKSSKKNYPGLSSIFFFGWTAGRRRSKRGGGWAFPGVFPHINYYYYLLYVRMKIKRTRAGCVTVNRSTYEITWEYVCPSCTYCTLPKSRTGIAPFHFRERERFALTRLHSQPTNFPDPTKSTIPTTNKKVLDQRRSTNNTQRARKEGVGHNK